MLQIFKPFRFIPKQEIERRSNEILALYEQANYHKSKWPLDTSQVAEFLGLDVVWDRIPDDENGVIAARILPLEHLIEINEKILELKGGFSESTLAHEIGHWVLHIDSEEVDNFLKEHSARELLEIEPLLCRSDFTGIEWQAQYFASCLLMPTFRLLEVSYGKELTRWQDLYQIAQEMGVTISNLVHRLKDLGWIEIDSKTIKQSIKVLSS